MSQEIYHSKYLSDQALEPGTYRIFNVQAGTAIQVSEHDPTRVVTWEKHDGKNQQWFLQRSGHGYQLQNRHHDAYLAVSNTDKHGLVYASRYPTTWVFLKFKGNHIVQLADRDRCFDLHHCLNHNGNEIHIWGIGEQPHKIWKLERLGDDPGNKELAEMRGELLSKNKELAQLRDELSDAEGKLSELQNLLDQRSETISQLQQDLKSKEKALSRAYEVNEQSAHLRTQHSLLESKFSQQQSETASLQAKMDRVEYLMSQMMSKSGGNIAVGARGANY